MPANQPKVGTPVQATASFAAILDPTKGMQPATPSLAVLRVRSPLDVITEYPMTPLPKVGDMLGVFTPDSPSIQVGGQWKDWLAFAVGSGNVIAVSDPISIRVATRAF